MKKKIVIIFIILLLVVGGSGIFIFSNRNINTNYNMNIMSQQEFSQYITEIPITTENWKDYFDIEDTEETRKDAFGDITSILKYTLLKLKDDNIYGCITLKLKILESDTTNNEQIITIYNGMKKQVGIGQIMDKDKDNKIYDTRIDKNNIQCIQAKGTIYKIEIPQEKWQQPETNRQETRAVDGKTYSTSDNEFIRLENNNSYITLFKETYLKQLGEMKYYQEQNN